MTDIVFLDTETTGLSIDDDIWEFAGIRRNGDWHSRAMHLFIEHDTDKCVKLPDSFRADHQIRYRNGVQHHDAARRIHDFLAGAHIVGAVPNFDTEHIAILLRRHGYEPSWHYQLIDVEILAAGWLAGRGHTLSLPLDSDELSLACDVEPPTTERHTALGDAEWAMRLYDAVMR